MGKLFVKFDKRMTILKDVYIWKEVQIYENMCHLLINGQNMKTKVPNEA